MNLTKIYKNLYQQNNIDFFLYEIKCPQFFILSIGITIV